MKQIFIIRHAESTANAGDRTLAHDSIPLSEKGKLQALELADSFTVVPELVVISPYSRTYETALPYITKHQTVPVEIWNVHEFTYLNPKKYNGTTTEERMDAINAYWDKLDIHYKDSDDIESFYTLISRVKDFIAQVKERRENTIVIFSHGAFIQNLKFYLETNFDNSELSEEQVHVIMKQYQAIRLGEFPIKNASVHKLDL